MDNNVYTKDIKTHNDNPGELHQVLESGNIIYLPDHFFSMHSEALLLNENILDGKHKNISFDYKTKSLGGFDKQNPQLPLLLKPFMQGFAEFAKITVETLLPQYAMHLRWGRTSYRPAEIKGRASSKYKDDSRLHVDAFPSTPVNGFRILRIFCNINPYEQGRVWNIGQPYQQVLDKFFDKLPNYNPFLAKLLKWVKATKTLRTEYDHYQLKLHDAMKLDDEYQKTVKKTLFDFKPQSTWIVYTDHVSHAALSGQYLLEQTFYLPVSAMETPSFSPLHCLVKKVGRGMMMG